MCPSDFPPISPFFMYLLAKTRDCLALLYAILYFPAPFFWLIIYPLIGFWCRFGNRSFWIALPLWLISAAALILPRAAPLRRAFWRATLSQRSPVRRWWFWACGSTGGSTKSFGLKPPYSSSALLHFISRTVLPYPNRPS